MLDMGMGSFKKKAGHATDDPGEEDCGRGREDCCGRGDRWKGREGKRSEAHACSCKFGIIARMTRGKQKIEAQKRSAERNEKPKGSQIEARNAGLKTVCSVCKAPLANYKQLVDHFGSKHPKETVPAGPSS